MRNVRNINDVNVALRELYDFYDMFQRSSVNLSGKRFTNVGKHVDPTDFVRWDELPGDEDVAGIAPSKKASVGYDFVTFGCGIGTPVIVGNDITPPRIISAGSTSLITGFICANQNPVGGNTTYDIWLNGDNNSIFTSPPLLHVPGSARTVSVLPSFKLTTFVQKDVLRICCTGVAGGFAGQDVEVVLLCRVNS